MGSWDTPTVSEVCTTCGGEFSYSDRLDCYFCRHCAERRHEGRILEVEKVTPMNEVIEHFITARKTWRGEEIRHPDQRRFFISFYRRLLVGRIRLLEFHHERLSRCCIAPMREEDEYRGFRIVCTFCGSRCWRVNLP